VLDHQAMCHFERESVKPTDGTIQWAAKSSEFCKAAQKGVILAGEAIAFVFPTSFFNKTWDTFKEFTPEKIAKQLHIDPENILRWHSFHDENEDTDFVKISFKVTIKCQRSLERTLGLQFDEVKGIRLGECGICFQWKRMINFCTHYDHAFCRACLAQVECCPLCRNTKKLNLKTQPKAFIVLPENSFLWDRAKDVRFLTLENIDEALSTESEASGIIVTNK
jgi:hypothetical protein